MTMAAQEKLPSGGKNRRQLVGRNDFELIEGTVLWALVGAPTAKLRRVPEAVALHMVVGDLDDELGT